MPNKLISFIIPHYGRELLLEKTLQSIADQNFDLDLIEVFVVTQNKDLPGSILRFNKSFNLTILTQSINCTISELRNHGAKKSKGAYLAFLDADVSISPNWIKCMLEELTESEPNRMLVGAIQKNSDIATRVEKIRTSLNNIKMDSYVDTLNGSNLFLTSTTFELAGGFPSQLKTCEDIYFSNKVAELGTLFYTSKASYVHLGEDKNFRGLFKKEIWRGQSNLKSLKGRKIPLREVPSIAIPLLLVVCLVLSIILLSLGSLITSFIFALMMMIPVTMYSLRLYKHTKTDNIKFSDLLAFYFIYFSARSVGIYIGIFKIFKETRSMLVIKNLLKGLIKSSFFFVFSPVVKREGPKKSIYLTFDDGPHSSHTLNIVETLKKHNVKATFFMSGNLMVKYPGIVTKVITAGHQVGYHSYHHHSLKETAITTFYRDLSDGKKLLKKYNIGEYLYRPPYGDLSLLSIVLLILRGWKIVMWSIEGRDSFDTGDEVLNTLNPLNIPGGSIILLHDVYENTENLLPDLLENYSRAKLNVNKLSYK